MCELRSHKKIWITFLLLIGSVLFFGCSANNSKEQADEADQIFVTETVETDKISVAIVTDTGGINDSSFNQSAWEGLQRWGRENRLVQGVGGFDYLASSSDSDYSPNLKQLVEDDFDLVYGVGFLLAESVSLVAQAYPENHFAIIDTVVDEPNVASITFAEHEGSFLVGVAAALKTETNKIGFIGGVDSAVINKFEVGFIAGVHSINPEIEIDIQYAEDFNAYDKGKQLAKEMYENNIDIIYHAAGGTGNGVIAEAKGIKLANLDRDIWVIGVDRDQFEEGIYDDETNSSITFTSMVKRVDVAVEKVSNLTLEGNFPAGEEIVFGLDNKGIAVAETNEAAFTEEINRTVKEWETKIKNAEINVPQTRDELEQYEFTFLQ